jgi:hypothetical protein
MPDARLVRAGRETLEAGLAVGRGLDEARCRQDVDIGQHPVVDVAAERDDTRLVEDDRRSGRPDLERQLELLRGGKRVHVMPDVVAVGKVTRVPT